MFLISVVVYFLTTNHMWWSMQPGTGGIRPPVSLPSRIA